MSAAPSTPADPGDTASSGFVGSGGAQFAGKVVSFPRAAELLPISDSSLNARNVEENFRRTADALRAFTGKSPELYQLSTLLGGGYGTGVVNAAVGTSGDVRFDHSLGRVPKMIVLSVDLKGTGGQLKAAPAGALGAGGGNENAWTATSIYVRATVSSDYAFVIL